MAKRHDKKPNQEEERELTLKEQRLHHRDRERHKKLFTFVGIALGLALLLVLIGVVYQFLVLPNTAAAKVGDVTISTADFQNRVRYESSTMRGQLAQLQQLEQQFGGQGFFTSQISQLQATLSSPYSLGAQALDNMIEDILIADEAAARGITVTDEEVDVALREEIAAGLGLVTEPQATATADAGIAATATAALWTPTPTATPDPAITTTVPAPTPVIPTPAAVITETTLTQGLATLEQNLSASAGMSLDSYREIVRARLLREKVSAVVGTETVTATEEQVNARHILLTVAEPTPTPTAPITGTDTLTSEVDASLSVTETEGVTATADVTATAGVSPTADVTATNALTAETPVTATTAATTTAAVTDTAEVTGTAAVTTTDALTDTAEITATAPITGTQGPYTDAEALALANELRERILAGEDFAALAAAYSDDTTSAVNGGDLGWFGRGRMVAPFEEAAFSLPVGEVSEPVQTDYGYHLIEVLERDEARAKDPAQLEQEQAQAFQSWLSEQLASDQVQRTGDINAMLPTGL